MAKKGKNGEYKGLLGPVVLFSRNGGEHMRTATTVRKDTSKLVFDSRDDFKLIMKLIKSFKPLIDIGFRDHKVNRAAYHSALSVNRLNYNFSKKTTGVENHDWFQFSEGNLSGAQNVSARKTDDGKVEITWEGTENGLTAYDNDKVVSCILFGTTLHVLQGPENVVRSDGSLIIDPGKTSLETDFEVFIAFTVNPRNYKPQSDRNVSKSKKVQIR